MERCNEIKNQTKKLKQGGSFQGKSIKADDRSLNLKFSKETGLKITDCE